MTDHPPLFLAALQVARPLIEHVVATLREGRTGMLVHDDIQHSIYENFDVTHEEAKGASNVFAAIFINHLKQGINLEYYEGEVYLLAAYYFNSAIANDIKARELTGAGWQP